MRNNTWRRTDRPTYTAPVIGFKWVFRIKKHLDGTVQKYKVRLVAKGLRVPQYDFNNAFLNGDLEEETFMTQPEGSISSAYPQHVCQLQRSLYGLKQALRAWFTKLKHTLHLFGFQNTKSDTTLFTKFTAISATFIFVYVDDILVTSSSDSEIQDLKFTSQTKYVTDLLHKVEMSNAKHMPTPMTSGLKLSAHGGEPFSKPALYRSLVGGLQYATITRPDISYVVNKVSQFMHYPLESHWKAVKRILCHLAGTVHHGLRFQKSKDCRLYGFCDSNWGSDVDDRKSTSGFCVYLGPNLVSWSNRKQTTVSRNSTEAEYRSLSAGLT
ncbi:uncharacterized protein LOC107607060 [Arachis ipaensis]|uniref:uncharacterized protein LOC107607060 n=1 Tax=Arachis ipaensis TaxID=130454 RepID=UPI0007AF7F64|nr:uncharacterized protein LOC107607060 [Arachis ipaensis]